MGLALCNERADAGCGVERGNTCAPCAKPLSQSSLRGELHLDFSFEVLAGKLLVLADVGGHYLCHLFVLQQNAEPSTVNAHVVGHDGEVFCPGVAHAFDEGIWHTTQAKAANCQGHSISDKACDKLSAGLISCF